MKNSFVLLCLAGAWLAMLFYTGDKYYLGLSCLFQVGYWLCCAIENLDNTVKGNHYER